jgi:hypothetical protein
MKMLTAQPAKKEIPAVEPPPTTTIGPGPRWALALKGVNAIAAATATAAIFDLNMHISLDCCACWA